MKIGLQIPTVAFTSIGARECIGSAVEQADRAGFDSLWVMDHFFMPDPALLSVRVPGSATSKTGPGAALSQSSSPQELLDSWSTLNFIAARTQHAMLGTLVTGNTYRHPGLLVKMVNTLDALSDGRAYFGIGAAWEADEHHRLGIPFPPTSERFKRLEETLQLALQMWQGEDKPYTGTYYQLSSTESVPLNRQKPHPPIMVGGGGEKKTLRLAAQYADACNISTRYSLDEMRRKLGILQAHCTELGRPYAQIEKTSADTVKISSTKQDGAFTPAELVARYAQFAEIGIEHVMVGTPDLFNPAVMELLATEVLPAVKKL